MYGSSTQFKSWTFKNDAQLRERRIEANYSYIEKHGTHVPPDQRQQHFLTPSEELILVREYARRLRNFCREYRDPRDNRVRMPLSVPTTAIHYFLRFYLYNSVMDYHPRYIMHTCIFLACKVEEFFVTIDDYIMNLTGTKEQKQLVHSAMLNSELQTTQELQFHLIVHQPYRPVEGLFIDLKTRFTKLHDVEALRPAVEEFLEKIHLTDAPMLYAPSQLALAAVTTAASRAGHNIDSYVTDILFADSPQTLTSLIDAVRKIKRFAKAADVSASPEDVWRVEQKLALCRNPLNDPSTEKYRQNQMRLEQDDDDFPMTTSTATPVTYQEIKEDLQEDEDDDGVVLLDD